MLDQGPVMVITFHAQQLTRKHEGNAFSVSETQCLTLGKVSSMLHTFNCAGVAGECGVCMGSV